MLPLWASPSWSDPPPLRCVIGGMTLPVAPPSPRRRGAPPAGGKIVLLTLAFYFEGAACPPSPTVPPSPCPPPGTTAPPSATAPTPRHHRPPPSSSFLSPSTPPRALFPRQRHAAAVGVALLVAVLPAPSSVD